MATCYWPKQPKGSFWCNTIYLFATNFTMRLPATLSNWLRNNHFLALITRGHQGVTNQSIGCVTWVNSLEVENLWFGLIKILFIYFLGEIVSSASRSKGRRTIQLIIDQRTAQKPASIVAGGFSAYCMGNLNTWTAAESIIFQGGPCLY